GPRASGRASPVQPRLASGARPAIHAGRVRVRRGRGPRAKGEPGRPHAGRLPGRRPAIRQGQCARAPGRPGGAGRSDPAARDAGRCGSCSAEVNGVPRLTCMTRMNTFPVEEPVTIAPMKTFPIIRDLVTDVSFNFEMAKRVPAFQPRAKDPKTEADGHYRMKQQDIERVQEFRRCIECFLCQDVCHVLRNHETDTVFAGPRYMVRLAGLEMHPMDRADRVPYLKEDAGIGYCNITKCCTEVCPESIHITDNAIIPLKERVVDEFYDPLRRLWRRLRGAA